MIGQRLQIIRKYLKLSQEDISSQLGISYRAYSSYEREDRKPSIELMQKLVTIYNVNLNYLIVGKGEPFIAPEFENIKENVLKEVNDILNKYGIKKTELKNDNKSD